MEIMAVILVAFSFTCLVVGILTFSYRDRIRVAQRLENEMRKTNSQYLPPALEDSFLYRLRTMTVGNLSGVIRKMVPNNRRENYRLRLQRAGNPLNMDVDTFLFFKYASLFLLIIIGLVTRNPFVFVICLLIGLFMPDFYLKSRESQRRDQILKSFPDTLDLLTVSVQAGLGFDAALLRVTEKSKGPLVDEFEKTMKEISMGKPRRQALRDMADRLNVNDVTTFLSAIIQADQLGISISNILRVQSHQVRETRRMKTEEKAQKAPIKMLIPLVCFIFPVILVVLLGPALLQIAANLV